MEQWEWAWLAGLYEGEGSLSFTNRTGVCVRIGMTDEDVIGTVQRLYPSPSKRQIEKGGRRKPLYIWQLNRRDAVKGFLEGVLPYLHERRGARAREALKRLEKNLGMKSERTHCMYGHPFSGDNLYIWAPTGARSCQICRTRRDRERQARRKAERAAR